MSETLSELRLDAFLERLSSSAPTPGGGSAAALAGAAGAALVHMVLELTARRPGSPPDDRTLTELRAAAASCQSELLELVRVDAAAYDAVVAARRLPRDTDLEEEHRRVQIASAVREATRTPLTIVRRASDLLDLTARVAPIGNRSAISDIGVAALLAAASARGAALNVRINLPALAEDDELRADATAELDALTRDLDDRERDVLAAVEAGLG